MNPPARIAAIACGIASNCGDDVRFADDMIEKPARFLTALPWCNAVVVSCDA
jgi:hypothetical protein